MADSDKDQEVMDAIIGLWDAINSDALPPYPPVAVKIWYDGEIQVMIEQEINQEELYVSYH